MQVQSVVLHYLQVIIITIALLTFAELLIKFKHPFFLKLMLLLMTIAVAFNAFGVIYHLQFGYNRWLVELPRVVFGAAGFNFFAYIYNQQIKRYTMLIGGLVVLAQLSALVYFSFIVHYDEQIDMSTVKNFRLLKGGIRLVVSTFLVVFMIDVYKKLLKKYQSDNIYFAQMRQWSLFAMICTTLCYLSYQIIFIYQNITLPTSIILKGLADLTCVLFILFRPKFLNNTHLKITLSETFNFKTLDEMNPELFMRHFYSHHYYLNRDANAVSFCEQLQITAEVLRDFVEEKYHLSFIDLVNKHRVTYFIDLLNTGKFNHYTLDALAQMSGFNTRQNLTKAFKKYHGGTPSDLMKALAAVA